MLAQAHLLFVDVVLLQVEDHFLFQAGGVRLGGQIGQGLVKLFPHQLDAFPFQGFHLVVEGQDALDAAGDIGIEGLAFGGTVGAELLQGAVQGGRYGGPVFGGDDIGLLGVHHVGETEDAAGEDAAHAGVFQEGLGEDGFLVKGRHGAFPVVVEGLGIDAVGGVAGLGLVGDEQVYGSPYQLIGQTFAHFQVLVLGQEGTLDGDVGALGVEGADFKRELAAEDGGFGLAVAGHGLDHSLFFSPAKILIISCF